MGDSDVVGSLAKKRRKSKTKVDMRSVKGGPENDVAMRLFKSGTASRSSAVI